MQIHTYIDRNGIVFDDGTVQVWVPDRTPAPVTLSEPMDPIRVVTDAEIIALPAYQCAAMMEGR